MYAVSNAYLTAKNRIPQVHSFKLSGTVGNVAFTEANVLKGSLSITNKCSNGNDILVGSVNIGVLKCTFIGITVAENADIVLSEGLKLADESYEYVPLGVYRVAEANITRSGTEVTAYDRMSLFDKSFGIDTTYGKPYALASLACQQCGVNLGMTSAQMQALPNGDATLYLSAENDIETWRDYLFWLAQTVACFATVDRSGNLVFRPYGQSVSDTIDNHKRYQGASFSRFVTRYTGISVANTDKTTSYYGLTVDDGLTYNLGANPFLQSGTITERDAMRRNTLDGIANIAYTPFKASVNVGALYDLGDIIQHEDGLAENASISCVMRYVWKFNGGYEMEGVGKNPTLATARSKVDKSIQGLVNSMKDQDVQYYLFTNAEEIFIADGEEKKIVDILFASNKKTVVVFHAEILCDIETTVIGRAYYDAKCRITYRYNDLYLDEYKPKETWVDGNHILHLLYYFEIQTSTVAHFEALMEMTGGNATIGMSEIRSSIYGQNLVATDIWDGSIIISDHTIVSELTSPDMMLSVGMNESFVFDLIEPHTATFEDTILISEFSTPVLMTSVDIAETISVTEE